MKEDPEYTMGELFCCSFNLRCTLVKTLLYTGDRHPGGGGVLPIVGLTGRLRLKGLPLLSSQYIKGRKNCKGSQNQLQSGRNGG